MHKSICSHSPNLKREITCPRNFALEMTSPAWLTILIVVLLSFPKGTKMKSALAWISGRDMKGRMSWASKKAIFDRNLVRDFSWKKEVIHSEMFGGFLTSKDTINQALIKFFDQVISEKTWSPWWRVKNTLSTKNKPPSPQCSTCIGLEL